jgi:hypothetical protein
VGVTEAAGIGLEGLDFGIEPLGHGIGYGEKRDVEQSLQMLGQHLGDLYHFPQARFHHPAFPFFEISFRFLKKRKRKKGVSPAYCRFFPFFQSALQRV